MSDNIATCYFCKSEIKIDETFQYLGDVHLRSINKYICFDEKKCRKIKEQNYIENYIEKDRERKYLNESYDKIDKNEFRLLDKETQFNKKYNIQFNELVELSQKFNHDKNIIHYLYDVTGQIFSWNISKQYWYFPDKQLENELRYFFDNIYYIEEKMDRLKKIKDRIGEENI